jgi:hypothetical protein
MLDVQATGVMQNDLEKEQGLVQNAQKHHGKLSENTTVSKSPSSELADT